VGSSLSDFELKDLQAWQLDPVNLKMAAGECISLSGPSGSGKTQLLRAIVDLDPHEGTVLLDDLPCEQYTPPDWRRQVGLLLAESAWWYDTVGPHFSDPAAYQAEFEQLGFGLDVLDKPVVQLSSGERQRLALLRLLEGSPRVLLLDEPTASLDADSVSAVEALVARYRKQHHAAVLWVSHDKQQIQRVASRRLQLTNGRVEEQAS
jgi:putative ABC transport system ATP-binding protein